MFTKVLIANRGEIACRIADTCRRLGVHSVAVYSDADAGARHVERCDEGWRLGPAAAGQSYLDGERLLEVARRSGAEAIHPGYGFLSESAAFARACEAAGVVCIGPPPEAIEAMGSKSTAKGLMEQAGVPLLPGYHGAAQDESTLQEAAAGIGYPVLIKASAGGGGKGMRRVDRPEDFPDALAAARREAAAAFGDDRVLLEKCLAQPRHVELQVFADRQGRVIHLFERDCSVQRRHQKVFEEAPAPGLSEDRRQEMGQAAVRAAEAVGYVGAGTVEFIMAPGGGFYFMEMNTRLQVEHPVTEMITGLDLVEWQLRVAAGEPLPLDQGSLPRAGHAIEARIYAEDPELDFLPATGEIVHLSLPRRGRHVRVDNGVREGDTVTIHYDPMMAKLIVWDSDRASALRRLRAALGAFQVVGPTTNLAFLGAIAAHPAFERGGVDTGFIVRHRAELVPRRPAADDRVLALACLAELLRIEAEARARAAHSADPYSPWHLTTGWVLNDDNHHTLHLRDGDAEVTVTAHYRPGHFLLDLPGGAMQAQAEATASGELRADLGGLRVRATVVRRGDTITVIADGRQHQLLIHDPLAAGMEAEVREGSLKAPMPGSIIAVHVAVGEAVAEGQSLVVLSAMKMEYTVTAAADGVVQQVNVQVGEQVEEGAELLALATDDG